MWIVPSDQHQTKLFRWTVFIWVCVSMDYEPPIVLLCHIWRRFSYVSSDSNYKTAAFLLKSVTCQYKSDKQIVTYSHTNTKTQHVKIYIWYNHSSTSHISHSTSSHSNRTFRILYLLDQWEDCRYMCPQGQRLHNVYIHIKLEASRFLQHTL